MYRKVTLFGKETYQEFQKMGIYFSPVWHSILPEYRNKFGYIVSPKAAGTSGAWRAVEEGFPWVLDNGVYSGVFDEAIWLAAMDRFFPYQENCIAVVVPDVLHRNENGSVIGDWRATVEQFHAYVSLVADRGYRPAFVTQDGLPVSEIPWDYLDVLFIGGSDHHKLVESYSLIGEAKLRGKWVHVGRVNSAKRMRLFWMADSWDGTMLVKEPSIDRQVNMWRSASHMMAMKKSATLFDSPL